MAVDPAVLAKLNGLPEDVRVHVRVAYQKMLGWAGDLRAVDSKQDDEGWHVTLRFEGGAIDVLVPENDKGHDR